MSKRTEMKKRWDAFVQAFSALGDETFGMSPSAACVLLSAVVEVENNSEEGFRDLNAGVPAYAIFAEEKMVRIPDAYSNCSEFWKRDTQLLRAKVTNAGVAYVNKHLEVFNILFCQGVTGAE